MRLTIPTPPGRRLDVHVDPGVRAGELRRHLAVLTGDAAWAGHAVRLRVGDRALDDEHPAGAPPLLPGAHLAAVDAPDHDAVAAHTAGAHVAVLAGPSAGRLLPLPDGARTRTDLPSAGPPARDGSAVVLEVHRRGTAVHVRVHGARGTLTSPTCRRRAVGRRARGWTPGARLQVGQVVLELRGPATAPPQRARPPLPPWVWPVAASTIGSLLLAAVLRQPVLLLTALSAVAGVVGWRTGRGDAPPTTAARPPAAAADAADVAAVRLATSRHLHAAAAPVPGDDAAWPADRTIALAGPRAAALGAARALVVRTLGVGTGTVLVVRTARARDWRWARWWEPLDRLPTDDRDVLVVADGTTDGLGAWRLSCPHARLLLLVPEGAEAPAWASTVVRLEDPPRPDGRGARHGRRSARPAETVAEDVAEGQARTAAALTWVLTARTAGGAPRDATLGDLPGVPPPDGLAVAAAWARDGAAAHLAAPLGTGTGGEACVLDLVRDGPHALIAGTTGAGKSELLTTLVLSLALLHPPARLAVLLIDFKGGSGLGPLARLPHVVGHVHDLDLATARRTLVGLRAELRRREGILTARGCTDLAELDPGDPVTPGRLLVVVDELRALVDDLPEAGAVLARLAAQGRSLGLHLVLATQRPAGAVTADLRANVSLRLALRVADEEDSRDVVGTPAAAHVDVGQPGRALVRVGSRPVTTLQVARARHRRERPPVRLLPHGHHDPPGWRAGAPTDDDVGAWVAACRVAAADRPGPPVPWVPELPSTLPADATGSDPTDADGLLVAVADLPQEQRRADVRWHGRNGPLLAAGGPRSGRSTTLLTVGTHALLAGSSVHAIGLPDPLVARLRDASHEHVGTTVPLGDTHRVLLLLDALATGAPAAAPRTLLLVDGVDVLLEELGQHARGIGLDLLSGLLRRPPVGVHVAASGAVTPGLARLQGSFGLRLVLPVPDAGLDAQLGVPRELSGPRTAPGRAVACTGAGAALAQVVLPSSAPAMVPGPDVAPLRLGRLPDRCAPPRVRPTDAAHRPVPLGLGGPLPEQVGVDPARPLVVTGPPGSGRSSTLRTLARGWAARGHPVVLVRVGTAPEDAVPGVEVLGPAAAAEQLDRRVPTGATAAPAPVVLVDDVDLVERQVPGMAARLEELLVGHPRVGHVVLATTTEQAATGFRGPVAAALRCRQVLVLDARGPAAGDLLGPTAALHVDPHRRPPGRGVLRDGHRLVRVQVHDPSVPDGTSTGP